MRTNVQRPTQLIFITILVFLFGTAMFVYWILYVVRGMPLEGVPILSELINAALALITAIGLLRMRRWSAPFSMVLSGMWCYGVIGGINLVLEKGIDFSSPFGALTDTMLFPLVLAFALYMATYIWRHRELFNNN